MKIYSQLLHIFELLNKMFLFENLNINNTGQLASLNIESLYSISKERYLQTIIFFIRKYQRENYLTRMENQYVEKYLFELKNLEFKYFVRYVEDFYYRVQFGNYIRNFGLSIFKIKFNIFISLNVIPLYKKRLCIDRKYYLYNRDQFMQNNIKLNLFA